MAEQMEVEENIEAINHIPPGITVKFENLSRYANRFSIELDPSASFSDYVSAVSKYKFTSLIIRHFVMDYDVDEDSTIVEFLQSLQNNKIKPLKPSQLKASASKKPKVVAPVPTTHSDSQSDEEGKLYCICHKPSYGEMIACDNPDCPIEWFHCQCVGVSNSKTKEKWYCPECIKHM